MCLECFFIMPLPVPVVEPFMPPPEPLGCVASGPPAFELPPAVFPAVCATAKVLVSANTAANAIVLNFMGDSSAVLSHCKRVPAALVPTRPKPPSRSHWDDPTRRQSRPALMLTV